MATEDIYPSLTTIGTVFPSTVRVDYAKQVGSTDKFPDQQVYTIAEIYGMIRADLEDAGVSPERISFPRFLFYFRQILNDYSRKVEEFQFAVQFTGGGGVFKIPAMNSIISLDVNGYGATAISEQGMNQYRAAESSTLASQWLYSVNGDLLSIYPAIGSSDTVTIFASVFAEGFDEDSADAILPQADGFILFDGVRWKCRESHGKDYREAQRAYTTALAERKSWVEHQLYPSQMKPADIL